MPSNPIKPQAIVVNLKRANANRLVSVYNVNTGEEYPDIKKTNAEGFLEINCNAFDNFTVGDVIRISVVGKDDGQADITTSTKAPTTTVTPTLTARFPGGI